jgi:hypothetical protein
VLAVLAVVLPFFTYGPAYCMWQAIDILLRPPEPDDFESLDDSTRQAVPEASPEASPGHGS